MVAAVATAFAAAANAPVPYSTECDTTQELDSLAQLVTAEWPDLRFSAALSNAARLVAEVSKHGEVPSSADVRTALHKAGLPEGTAVTSTVATTEEGPDDVLDHLAGVLQGVKAATHVGLGRVPASRPPFEWQWVILLIDRRITLSGQIPAVHQPGTAFPLSFSLRAGWTTPRIIVQYPDQRVRRMTPVSRAGGWYTVVPVGSSNGKLVVQVLADNDVGPGVVAVMPMEVGQAVSDSQINFERQEYRSGAQIGDATQAAQVIWKIVNDERNEHGLNRLVWDPRLASVATLHSQDMVGAGFFGHKSPSCGDLRERLAKASYFAAVSRENLALDQDLESAHRSLMASPGHRSNILAADVTHLGIGVVMQELPDGVVLWTITEIFSRPQSSIPENQ